MSKNPDDNYSDEETRRRAEEALRGAFKTPPMPMEKEKEAREQKPPRKK